MASNANVKYATPGFQGFASFAAKEVLESLMEFHGAQKYPYWDRHVLEKARYEYTWLAMSM